MRNIDRGFPFDGLPKKEYDCTLAACLTAWAACAAEVQDDLFKVAAYGNGVDNRRKAARCVVSEGVETMGYHAIRMHDSIVSGLDPRELEFVLLEPGAADFTTASIPVRSPRSLRAHDIAAVLREAYAQFYSQIVGQSPPATVNEALQATLHYLKQKNRSLN